MTPRDQLKIATRKSPLALWQAEFVKAALERLEPGLTVTLMKMQTSGDRFLAASLAEKGGKGLFVKELETALLDGSADLAVHSMKDVPVRLPDRLGIGAVLARHDPRDAFVSGSYRDLDELPNGAAVATSSLRRSAQLKLLRPDLAIVPLRGNVNTRLRKLDEGEFDAAVLAVSGLERLGFDERIAGRFPVQRMIPAIAQGALGIETRRDDEWMNALVARLEDATTRTAVNAERALNAALEGGCHLPVAAFASIDGQSRLELMALVAAPDGARVVRDEATGDAADAEAIGNDLAERMVAGGAGEILAAVGAR